MTTIIDGKNKTPVIDVHAHVFTARDIPIVGYLKSRKGKSVLERLLSWLLVPQLSRCLDKEPRERGALCNLMLELVSIIMGGQYGEWARTLSYDGVDIAKELVDTFPDIDLFVPLMIDYEYWFSARRNRIVTLIARPVDYVNNNWIRPLRRRIHRSKGLSPAPTPVQQKALNRNKRQAGRSSSPTQNAGTAQSFAGVVPIKAQIRYVYEQIIVPSKGRIHPFVAFDPARQLAKEKRQRRPNSQEVETDSPQEMVQHAIDHWGFIGVKLYNSLGYKPLDNASVQKYRRNKIPLHRWYGKRRYHRYFKGQDYDDVLRDLYAYCEKEGVPITTHCGMYGIEAFPNASWVFGQAAFWREVLQEYPELHLNLAHFGWNFDAGYDEIDENGFTSWAQEICEMLVKYPNVYTDVAHHQVLDYPDQRRFNNEYTKMRNAAGSNWDTIKKKILFGIDWHVIKRERNYANFQAAYTQVVREGGLYSNADLEDFLYGNAMRFLGLEPGGKSRPRLAAFYAKHGIAPPPWF